MCGLFPIGAQIFWLEKAWMWLLLAVQYSIFISRLIKGSLCEALVLGQVKFNFNRSAVRMLLDLPNR